MALTITTTAAGPRHALAIAMAMLASVALYALLFGWVLHKPLSVGTIADYFSIKTARAAALPSPKLVFFGGSNVRFGLSCELAERQTGVPCVNAGFLADVGIDLMAEKFTPLLHAGDVVYIPLAYEQYLWDRDFVVTQRDAAYLFAYDRATLRRMPMVRQLHALFHFDLPYLASAIAENVLAKTGLRRQAGATRVFGAGNLNAWGDETGHTAEQGRVFEALIAATAWKLPPLEDFTPERYFYTQVLEHFIASLRARGVVVVGGLVQVADDVVIDPRMIERVRAIYERNGAGFIELPNRSQYPRSCFFDSVYHLNEECQRRHTAELLQALSPYLPSTDQAGAQRR
ncbi:hypothetical protein [Sinimarinibacterium thermocellulolyticum]|uniref:SGNH/GDSL hydrolase family protein n=1 Tax=Sinimarinibacterium thermocellulolyticum TaxID=3170016 RepID=A0ABV2A9X9_9GAMM